MILVIDAAVKKESRTRKLTKMLLEKMDDEIYWEKLSEFDLKSLDEKTLAFRDQHIAQNDFTDSYFDLAKRFKDADAIVICAPYYDLSFPSLLKLYFERITISGLLFKYTESGPVGLCKAKKMYYVVTAGGKIYNDEYFYGYAKDLFKSLYGIRESKLIKAEMLDVWGMNPEEILENTEINL